MVLSITNHSTLEATRLLQLWLIYQEPNYDIVSLKKTSKTTNYRATIMKNDDDKTKDNHVTQSSTVLPEVVVPVIPVRTRGGGRSQ